MEITNNACNVKCSYSNLRLFYYEHDSKLEINDSYWLDSTHLNYTGDPIIIAQQALKDQEAVYQKLSKVKDFI